MLQKTEEALVALKVVESLIRNNY